MEPWSSNGLMQISTQETIEILLTNSTSFTTMERQVWIRKLILSQIIGRAIYRMSPVISRQPIDSKIIDNTVLWGRDRGQMNEFYKIEHEITPITNFQI